MEPLSEQKLGCSVRSPPPLAPPQCSFALVLYPWCTGLRLPPGHYPLVSGQDPVSSEGLASPLPGNFGPRLAFSFPSSPGPPLLCCLGAHMWGAIQQTACLLSSWPSLSPHHSISLLPQRQTVALTPSCDILGALSLPAAPPLQLLVHC